MRKSKKAAPRRRKSKAKFIRRRQPKLFTEIDAKKFDVPPPEGWSYVWVEEENVALWISHGWRETPPKLHPQFSNDGSRIIYLGSILLRIPANIADAKTALARQAAEKQLEDFNHHIGLNGGLKDSLLGLSARGFCGNILPIMEGYTTVRSDAPTILTTITIPVRIKAEQQDTASALKLTPQEYARRRVLMLIKHEPFSLEGSNGAIDLVPPPIPKKETDG